MSARKPRTRASEPSANLHDDPAKRQLGAVSDGEPANGRKTQSRLRWNGNLPKPPKGDVPWAKCRPELAALSEADHVRLVQKTSQWQQLMVPACHSVDRARSRRGVKFLYSSEELELVLLYGRACGHTTYKETRKALAGDDGVEARETSRQAWVYVQTGPPPRAT